MIKSLDSCTLLLEDIGEMIVTGVIDLFSGGSTNFFESSEAVTNIKENSIWAFLKKLLGCVFLGVAPTAISLSYSAGACTYNTIYSDSIQGRLHCKCLQGITGTLQGNRSAGISNLWGLHVYRQSL